MSRLILTMSKQDATTALDGGIYDEVFLWTGNSSDSTFVGSTDPYLSELGEVNTYNVDLVRIALAVLASDRSILRTGGGSDWNVRDFDVTIPVDDPRTWTSHADQLSAIAGFLSGDRWRFDFVPAPAQENAPQILPMTPVEADRTVLLSGGADSAIGALVSAAELEAGASHALVSQWGNPALPPVQRHLICAIGNLVSGVEQSHHQFHLHRASRRLDGTDFQNEYSSRSRSLLFLALGLAVAETTDSTLWIPENGFASLNPPLGPDRRGSLSTRTTHPWFLTELAKLLRSVGGHGTIENPFAGITKGEMFRRAREAVGVDAVSTFLSSTNSCAHTDGRYQGASAGSSCGVCFGCLVRRASFIVGEVPDQTDYLLNDTSGRFDDYLNGKSAVEQMRDFVHRGVGPREVIQMSLPDDYPPAEALELSKRGVEELRGLFS